MQQSEPVWSVSAVNRALRETIEGAFMPFWMGGEAGSVTLHRSGHAYLQIKDDKSQIRVLPLYGCMPFCSTKYLGRYPPKMDIMVTIA